MAVRRSKSVSTWWNRQWRWLKKNLNFFRVHVLFFTFTPLIFSGLLYAANSPTPNAPAISYIDALFNCVSAMNVCGLATVDLSRMTGAQQALLFIQCCLGSPIAVAWVMVLIRRNAFAKRFAHLRVKTDALKNRPKINFDDPSEVRDVLEVSNDAESGLVQTTSGVPRSPTVATSTSGGGGGGWVSRIFSKKSSRSRTDSSVGMTASSGGDGTTERNGDLSTVEESDGSDRRTSTSHSRTSSSSKSKKKKKLKTTMIRRINDKVRVVDPSGQPAGLEIDAGVSLTRTTSPEDVGNAPSSRPAPENLQPLAPEERVEDTEMLAAANDATLTDFEPEAGILQTGTISNGPNARGIEGATPRLTRTITLNSQPTWNIQTPRPPRMAYTHTRQSGVPLGHTMTVEFLEPEIGRGRTQAGGNEHQYSEGATTEDAMSTGADTERVHGNDSRQRGRSMSGARSMNRRNSVVSSIANGGAGEIVWDDKRSTILSLPHTDLRPRRTPTVQSQSARSHTTHMTPPNHSSALPRTTSIRDRSYSVHTYPTHTVVRPDEPSALHTGYGGFPGPHILIGRLMKKVAPHLRQRLHRTLTIPRTQTIPVQSPNAGIPFTKTKSAPYLSFTATIGRNSNFRFLTEEELEELGGVEYRALNALLWIVGAYHILVQLLALIVIWPYISQSRWRSSFQEPALHRYVAPGWFSAFQVTSAYTNTGMSLVDQSMIPFQRAYPMIIFMAFLILAGNTAFYFSRTYNPGFALIISYVMVLLFDNAVIPQTTFDLVVNVRIRDTSLRLVIWIITKCVPVTSRTNETLHFLLDHPRRCFIYLFPSHQTWFLLTILIMLNFTDWFFFLVLDIGNPTFDSVPLGVRFAIGFLQGIAVRAAGFGTIPLSALAPAVQVLYVMMMYISVYPIAMSVRSTNVYEERSLGVFEEDEYDSDREPDAGNGSRVAIWGRYLAWHARKQLAFDMWWLGLALFLVCIIERSKIQDEVNLQYFTIFNIIFELISAYGTVGLSLGVPFGNFSFSGAFTPLSKLIVCAVMIRGRHRGLPVAIDRAVMLPFEFKLKKNDRFGHEPSDAPHSVDPRLEGNGFGNGDTEWTNKEANGIADFEMNGHSGGPAVRNDDAYEEDDDSELESEHESVLNSSGNTQAEKAGTDNPGQNSYGKDENESLKENERTNLQ